MVQYKQKSDRFGITEGWVRGEGMADRRWSPLPKNLSCSHCDMPKARSHPSLGSFANSDMFIEVLIGKLKASGAVFTVGGKHYADLDSPLVRVDGTGFLATVSISLPD